MLKRTLLSSSLLMCSSAMAAGDMIPVNGLKSLILKDEHIEVVLEDGYAVTRVHQVFYNPNSTDLEAKYSFPIPDKAAVGEFAYYIDGKPVFGEVLEKNEAKEVYEDQKSKGKEAALLEKNDYKTFDMNVYPVKANDDVRVQMAYFQPVKVDSGIGRYLFPIENSNAHDQTDNFWKDDNGDYSPHSFSFNLIIKNDYPIEQVKVPVYNSEKIKTEDGHWKININNGIEPYSELRTNLIPLDPGTSAIVDEFDSAVDGSKEDVTDSGSESKPSENNESTVNQDITEDVIVYFKHEDNQSGDLNVSFQKEGDVGTFMAVLTPANDLKPIKEGKDWVFVLDKSGSMSRDIETLATGVELALSKLTENDRFQIVWFNDKFSNMTGGKWVNGTASNIEKYSDKLKRIDAEGGTNVFAGMKEGLDQFDDDRTGSMILVTDGVANVGITERKSFLSLMKDVDVRLFTFVIGNSANKPLLEPVTKYSNGYAVNVSNADEIVGVVKLAIDKATHEAYHGVKFNVESKSVKHFNVYPESIGTLYKGQQLIVMGKYTGSGEATVTMSGKVSGEDRTYDAKVIFPDLSTRNPELERLWAFSSIQNIKNHLEFTGEEERSEKELITDIALKHGLVTDYTSMIVIKEEEFRRLNIDRKNAERVEKEHEAQNLRKSSKTTATSSASLVSSAPSSSGSGSSGGSLNWLSLLMLLPMVVYRTRRKKV